MGFEDKDHFSGHAGCYEAFRPTYPEALFAYLSSLCPLHDLAWDCATGNGQAAVPLAAHFRAVIATDASHKQIVGADWPPERRLVEERYRTLAFPFEEFTPPPFQMVHSWELEHLLGYLGSWSSVQRYRTRTGLDPLELIRTELEAVWGDSHQARDVTWPLHLRVGGISLQC